MAGIFNKILGKDAHYAGDSDPHKGDGSASSPLEDKKDHTVVDPYGSTGKFGT
jgi:hypothetical protein